MVWRVRRAVGVIACLAMVLGAGACQADSAGKRVPGRTLTGSPTAAPSPELENFYSQELEWKACAPVGYQCATMEVPMDWDAPEGRTIRIAVTRHRASASNPIGSLLLNPGGPGASGISFASDAVNNSRLSADVVKNFDVVGFDPRGVGRSAPVSCLTDKEMDDFRAFSFPDTPAGIEQGIREYKAFADACESHTGKELGYVDTVSAARDMDVLRALLGDERLYYLGYSYGSFLGTVYAGLFPQNVGRLVLDGAIDPTLDEATMLSDQLAAFEKALRVYVEDCQTGANCPLTGDVDSGMQQIQGLFARAGKTPLPTGGDRRLTDALAVTGVIGPLYDTSWWYYLTDALSAALEDNSGAELLRLSDTFADRSENGTYSSNSNEANPAINCLDLPHETDITLMGTQAEELTRVSPTFGPYFGYSELQCAQWPVEATGTRQVITADGAAPILVVGTTGDPATPYHWAQALSGQLSSAVLLTYDGQGHTAYGRSNECVTKAVDAYLLDGTTPDEGTVC